MSAYTDDLSKSRILMMEGYAPQVKITDVLGGHKLTITDINHPEGQSFYVYDGDGKDFDVYVGNDLAMEVLNANGGRDDITAAEVEAMLEEGRRVRLVWDTTGAGDIVYAYPRYSFEQGAVSFFAFRPNSNNKMSLVLLYAQDDSTSLSATYYKLES